MILRVAFRNRWVSSFFFFFLAVIQGEDKTVLLSAGATSGVQLGYEFTIRRGQQPIAKVRVYKVGPGLCEARIVYHQAETAVVEGDEARTR